MAENESFWLAAVPASTFGHHLLAWTVFGDMQVMLHMTGPAWPTGHQVGNMHTKLTFGLLCNSLPW